MFKLKKPMQPAYCLDFSNNLQIALGFTQMKVSSFKQGSIKMSFYCPVQLEVQFAKYDEVNSDING